MLVEFFAESVGILITSLVAYVTGMTVALIFYKYNRHRALKICEEIDKSRARIMTQVGVKKYFTAAARVHWQRALSVSSYGI